MTCYELKILEDTIDTALRKREESRNGVCVVISEDERWRIERWPERGREGVKACACKATGCIWWKWHVCPGSILQQEPLPKYLRRHVPCVELQNLAYLMQSAMECRNKGSRAFAVGDCDTGWSITYRHNARVYCGAALARCHAKECRWHRVGTCAGKTTEELVAERRAGV